MVMTSLGRALGIRPNPMVDDLTAADGRR